MNRSSRNEELPPARKWPLALELLALFAGVPLAHTLGWLPIPVIVVLLGMAGACWLALRAQGRITPGELARFEVSRTEWRRMLKTFALAVLLMAGGLWLLQPGAMFSLLSRNPKLWALVMVAYPLVSVLPQELIYRVFCFKRYRPLFGGGLGMSAASAIAFSLGHIVFRNWPAVVLTLFGGWLFARTYQRTGSLFFVAIEHALYGCAVFTIGLGGYFVEGTLRLFQQAAQAGN